MARLVYVRIIVVAMLAFASAHGVSAQFTAQNVELTPQAKDAYVAIGAQALVKKGLAFLEDDAAKTLDDQKIMTAIPAPPFKEAKRAEYFRNRLQELGLQDVRLDSEGNAIGVHRGSGGGPKLVISAHLDTVFPEGTDVSIKEKDGRLYAPGIADDTRGLAELLSIIRALNHTGLKTVGDVWFVGTVGEEELGDLRGVKALFRDQKDIDGFITIESPGGGVNALGQINVGSRRFRVTFKGPGGHSFGAFGLPSAIHAMGRAIAKISDIQTPSNPKTTFTVGTVAGGISTNSIAGEAAMQIDMRSSENSALQALEAEVLEHIQKSVAEENARWGATSMTVDIKLVGDRPAGKIPMDSPMFQAAAPSLELLGLRKPSFYSGSNDANLPASLGIPATRLSSGGRSGGTHTFQEWYEPTLSHQGPQVSFLTMLGLVGIEGVSQPILPKRPPRP
ncbi:ArgE Acetylornithine deacetylase/Succinyl-diaminopimelate desuccinylase and related deacylases [Rhabdaerophilaceae bacterium]